MYLQYATEFGGSSPATADDFRHKTGILKIPAGTTSGLSIAVDVNDDNDETGDEGDETFLLNVWSNDVDLASNQIAGIIHNDANDACNGRLFLTQEVLLACRRMLVAMWLKLTSVPDNVRPLVPDL